MKASPIWEPVPHATQFEGEVVAGKIRHAQKGARKGWQVAIGSEQHRVFLPKPGFRSALRPRLLVDSLEVKTTRGVGRRTTEFAIGNHAASIQQWTVFEPAAHWARRAGLRRAGLLAFLIGLISTGAGAGAAAGSLRSRRYKTCWTLTVEGRSAGTWIIVSPDAVVAWEFIAAEEDLASAVDAWDRQADMKFRGGPDVAASVDDQELAEVLGQLAAGPTDRWVGLTPDGSRAFTIRLEVERPRQGNTVVTAKVPVGPGAKRAALSEVGWRVETDKDSSTRYFVRRFAIATDSGADIFVSEARSAYRAIYGERLRIGRWILQSGEAGTARIDV